MKIQQNEKSARKSNKKHLGKSEKTSPKWANFHKNTPNMPLAVHWNSKSAIKFEKKTIRKTDICKKQAQKTSKFQLKQSQKQATRKPSKKHRSSTKKQAQFRGKNARLAALLAAIEKTRLQIAEKQWPLLQLKKEWWWFRALKNAQFTLIFVGNRPHA